MNALEKILIDLALDKKLVEQSQIDEAMKIQKSSPMKNFGRILAEMNLISESQLEELKREADHIFRNKGYVPGTANGSISLNPEHDFSNFIQKPAVKRYSKPRQSDIISEVFERKENDKLIGSEFVGCKIISKLGQGGMGKIYKVKHLFLNKYMAMKILAQQYTEQKQFVHRFFREARSASKLDHPNIVKIFDVGVMDGEYYMLMQLVDGIDLKKIIEKQGRVSIRDAIYITAEVAKALVEAHRQKIIHRDIKPDNIMLDKSHVLVTDFGLAKIEKGEGEGTEVMTLTGPGQVLGSPYFMAPEQADSSHGVDHRSDIYSLGSTLYYMITGKYPFDAPNAIAIIFKRVNEPLIRPKKLNPLIPDCVNKLIVKMMALHRENRQENARALLREIDELPLKNLVKNFDDLDLVNDVDIDVSNFNLAQSEIKNTQPAPQIETPIEDRSTAKTKIMKIEDIQNEEVEVKKELPEQKLDSDFLTISQYNDKQDNEEEKPVFMQSDEFVSMTDFEEVEKASESAKKIVQDDEMIEETPINRAPKLPDVKTPNIVKPIKKEQSSKLDVKPVTEAERMLIKADLMFKTKKYAPSLHLYKDIVKKFPDNQLAIERTAEVEDKFRSANTHYRKAQQYYTQGEIEESVKEVKESLKFLPGNPDIVKFLNKIVKSTTEINKILDSAYNLYKTGKISEAIEKASESFKFVKNHPKTIKLIEKLQKVLDKRNV